MVLPLWVVENRSSPFTLAIGLYNSLRSNTWWKSGFLARGGVRPFQSPLAPRACDSLSINQSLTGLADRRLTKLVWRDVFTRCSMQLQSSWNLQRRRELFLEDWDGASKFARWQHPTLVYRARFAVPGSACRNSCWQQNDFMYNSSRDTDSTAAAEKFPGCGGSDRQIVWSSSTTFG